ncbi:hypothetical protein EVAR_41941_1 [Eumeta japonica]|uniref:Uncharacterized protein n=1 Tax=Eumeta variegata TaxID=151549 RepID=A0A4C1XJL1_EUMVA|nr:hypothetical protein EVAR_41941_1 [Eumeta japonica]
MRASERYASLPLGHETVSRISGRACTAARPLGRGAAGRGRALCNASSRPLHVRLRAGGRGRPASMSFVGGRPAARPP